MSASEDITKLLKWLEPHVGEAAVQFDAETFAQLHSVLLGIRNDVRTLENHYALQPRACASPPWFDQAAAPNVVSIDSARGPRQ